MTLEYQDFPLSLTPDSVTPEHRLAVRAEHRRAVRAEHPNAYGFPGNTYRMATIRDVSTGQIYAVGKTVDDAWRNAFQSLFMP